MTEPIQRKPDTRIACVRELERQATAYHEAAHAIVHCLFGEGEHIDVVMLHGKTEHEAGRIQLKPFSRYSLPEIAELASAQTPRDVLQRHVMRFVINCFAGPAAELRIGAISGDEGRDSFLASSEEMLWTDLFDCGLNDLIAEVESDRGFDLHGATEDFELAFGAALILVGPDPKGIGQFLRECAAKTDRLVNDEANWTCIDELANELLNQESLLGDVIHEKFSPNLNMRSALI